MPATVASHTQSGTVMHPACRWPEARSRRIPADFAPHGCRVSAMYARGMRDWSTIAAAAADDAGRAAPAAGQPPGPELLGGFLPALARAGSTGRRLDARALAGFRALGARAAD